MFIHLKRLMLQNDSNRRIQRLQVLKDFNPKKTFTICVASDHATKQQELDAFSEAVVMAEKAA